MIKKTIVESLSGIFGKNTKVGRIIGGYEKMLEAKFIAEHFSTFLRPVVAHTDELKKQSYSIRHNVYCEEMKFEEQRPNKLEIDSFDAYSTPCLIQHKNSGKFAGTVRLVTPKTERHQLPIEKFCLSSITHETLNPCNFAREDICEISRLAVPSEFRKRKTDRYSGASVGVINEATYSENELRCFPFIAIGLYFSAASVILNRDIKHTYVMMEPRLARSMRFIGIHFEPIGPVVEYHGKRAPYYINPQLFYKSLRPNFLVMLRSMRESLD